MRRSKLESYEDILEALVNRPLTLENIRREAELDQTEVKRHLLFLMKNGLVEERDAGRKRSYAVTERGVAVFRALNFQKYLGKIKNTIMAIDEAMEVIPKISEKNRENGKPED